MINGDLVSGLIIGSFRAFMCPQWSVQEFNWINATIYDTHCVGFEILHNGCLTWTAQLVLVSSDSQAMCLFCKISLQSQTKKHILYILIYCGLKYMR
jgi:hypothetical protein